MRLQNELSQSGEVFTIWSHLASNNGFIVENQSFFNQTTDSDMKRIIVDFTHCLKEENRHLKRQLINIGIKPTPALTAHSKVKIKPVRAKTRLSNTDISAALSMNISTSLITTSTALGEAISEDNVKRYAQFHMKKAVLGAKLIELSNIKKWFPAPTTRSIKSR
ncbi:DUF3231 family protein [Lysinibacillus sp. NPDC097287]|uniref:DUF3231 family protein n=1 Tax=Lysinibacillus sp. NPDC097287 TaxID=3364144 RepID=UPI00382A13EA